MSKVSRFGWGAAAVLFLGTLIMTTAYAIINSKSSQQSNTLTCTQASKLPNQQPKAGKVKGAQLADFTPPQKVSAIACIDYKIGTGAEAQSGSTITANYIGALASTGTIFDDSFDTGHPLTTQLTGVIPGWQIGVPGMKLGGVRRLFIPAGLGYGSQALNGIPANSDLVFDIQLIDAR